MSGDKHKHDTSHVSLFPSPPWQLITRQQSSTPNQTLRPPTPPGSNIYRMFGNLYNADDAMLRSLESQGVRRVYPQVYNRKRELRKINFSILANYLDLLDIVTRDPSSPKRAEWLDHLAVLFINMHHLVNEYRQHQARDLLREVLKYQVAIASQTVEKADQYLARADEILRNAGNDLVLPAQSSQSHSASCIDAVRNGLVDLGPTLAPLVQTVLDETMGRDSISRQSGSDAFRLGDLECSVPDPLVPKPDWEDDLSDHLDATLWNFLSQSVQDTDNDARGAMNCD